MALQQASKLININRGANALKNCVRNRSRISVPSLFFEDPFEQHRSLMNIRPSDFWKTDPFDMLLPPSRLVRYRMPVVPYEDEKNLSNRQEGFHVELDVKHFTPEEINVKVVDNSIIVEAKHEERSDGDESFISRHFSRRYVLPEEYSIKDVISTLSSDGILTVKAPPKEIDPKNVRNIDIQHTGPAKINSKSSEEQNKSKENVTETENK